VRNLDINKFKLPKHKEAGDFALNEYLEMSGFDREKLSYN